MSTSIKVNSQKTVNLRKLAKLCRSYFGTGFTLKEVTDFIDFDGTWTVKSFHRKTKQLVSFSLIETAGCVSFGSMDNEFPLT